MQFIKKNWHTIWELIKYTLVSVVVCLVELGVFSLGTYVLFARDKGVDFSFFIFHYDAASGGRCAFYAFVLSFVIGQTLNFILMRRVTFRAVNRLWLSIVHYIVMLIMAFAFTTWLPTVITEPVYSWVGESAGPVLVKWLTQFASTVIYYPMTKWVVMRNH